MILALCMAMGLNPHPAGSAEHLFETDIGIGHPGAPVRIVEYFSFSCPHCARFHRQELPWLRRNYIDRGKVYLVLRDFPLNLAALKGAQAAHCDGAERYVELVDALWMQWDSWINDENVEPPLIDILTRNGVSRDEANLCLADNNEVERAILISMRSAIRRHGLERTPSFLVNGRLLAGLPSQDVLEKVIKEELNLKGAIRD